MLYVQRNDRILFSFSFFFFFIYPRSLERCGWQAIFKDSQVGSLAVETSKRIGEAYKRYPLLRTCQPALPKSAKRIAGSGEASEGVGIWLNPREEGRGKREEGRGKQDPRKSHPT